MTDKLIVIDANILIRAVLGIRTYSLIENNRSTVRFYTPEACYQEVTHHIPHIAQKRHLNSDQEKEALETLNGLKKLVVEVEADIYSHYKKEALTRISEQDKNDWSIVALSLALECPIWTEDKDFFGTGIATWRTKNIDIFFNE